MPADAPPDLAAIVGQLLDAVRTAASARAPQLLDAAQAATYCGLSRSGLYRLLAADEFPRPVRPEGGSNTRWKRNDLDKWVERLKPSGRAKGR